MTRDFFVSAGGVEKKLVLCYNKYIITHTFHHDLTRKGGRGMDIELTEEEYLAIYRHHNLESEYFRHPLHRALVVADAISTGWWKMWHLRKKRKD